MFSRFISITYLLLFSDDIRIYNFQTCKNSSVFFEQIKVESITLYIIPSGTLPTVSLGVPQCNNFVLLTMLVLDVTELNHFTLLLLLHMKFIFFL
jgi:hypothetical protein